MSSRPSIDDYLLHAAVPAPTPDPRYENEAAELAASRRRIEEEIADTLWQEALHRDSYAQQFLTARPIAKPDAPFPRPPVALQEQSARDLAELSRMVIATSNAAADIAGLVNSQCIEPDGALIFACLLHLSDRHDGAQFWWQFSAGAGKSTAALCLYLLHLQRGEMRDADHWANEATTLEVLDHLSGQHMTRPARVFYAWEEPTLYGRGFATVESMLLRTVTSLGDGPAPKHTRPWRDLTAAVKRLSVDHDPCFGDIPRPSPDLAAQLEEAIAS
ncbi:hypothetical protein [Streptomyces litchfieldiae]|uniref:Uncharacterized protein n=1 Tax=Streptomyces litchfieldiae TaxID=3075543 RepID=A0ABU2N027_9ACTN|nr:hypothetical protein [Streptomyces sp. DSM 44938]MDT0347140.1 hypothetical protein [Streptomyces sp. DSM 44938]